MLKKATIPWTAKTLVGQIEKGKVTFDCAVQRGYVWDNTDLYYVVSLLAMKKSIDVNGILCYNYLQ